MLIVLFTVFILYLQISTLPAGEYVPVFKGDKINFYLKKYEVSNEEYCKFLNACARISDPYQLWNPLMQEHYFGGIKREIQAGEFRYKIKPGYENYLSRVFHGLQLPDIVITCPTVNQILEKANWEQRKATQYMGPIILRISTVVHLYDRKNSINGIHRMPIIFRPSKNGA